MPGAHHVAMNNPQTILELFARKGAIAYEGEGISQIEHAWQCGQLARAAGASQSLQLASWLHDLGHLLTDLSGSPTVQGIDDRHEHSAAGMLDAIWGPAVAEPVRLHVAAKRYLVAAYPEYCARLSPDSVRSLALQGGPMDLSECVRFQASPYALDAQQLRAWDDSGKRVGWFASDTQHALDELRALMDRVRYLPA
jgi:phosphonate degradation associated HDIG domain protein